MKTPPRFLAVKNFDRFQHYSDRLPPWIKLYYALLDDYAFLQLTEVQQIHLVLLWLVASRHNNRIPYDETFLRAAIRAKRRVDIPALVSAGFLIVLDASTDASTALAKSEHDASPPRARPRPRGEAEAETETELLPPPLRAVPETAEGEIALALPTDADRNALSALLHRVPAAGPWCAEMRASMQGMPGHHVVTPAQLGEALRDYVGNGAVATPNLRQFRRYLQSAAAPATPPPAQRRAYANGNGRHVSEDPDLDRRHRMRLVDARRNRDDGAEWWRDMERRAKAEGAQKPGDVFEYAYRQLAETPAGATRGT